MPTVLAATLLEKATILTVVVSTLNLCSVQAFMLSLATYLQSSTGYYAASGGYYAVCPTGEP
jgi:hypothetical protein